MVLKAIKEMKKPFNVKKFYRRTFLVIYDVISVILASYLALMIRYGFSLAEIPEPFHEADYGFPAAEYCDYIGCSLYFQDV